MPSPAAVGWVEELNPTSLFQAKQLSRGECCHNREHPFCRIIAPLIPQPWSNGLRKIENLRPRQKSLSCLGEFERLDDLIQHGGEAPLTALVCCILISAIWHLVSLA